MRGESRNVDGTRARPLTNMPNAGAREHGGQGDDSRSGLSAPSPSTVPEKLQFSVRESQL